MSSMRPHKPPTAFERLKLFLVGKPKDIEDVSIFHKLALIPFLAWIGLGSDGLSSSSYGPEEAFKTLGEHTYLAIGLVLLMALTIIVISAAYSKIIEEFPHGGGGYVVASSLLGRRVGVISGSALLVDYILTITVSIAAGADALFSFLPPDWQFARLGVEVGLILLLVIINLRGVKESVVMLAPIFILFLITHVIAIAGGIFARAPEIHETAIQVQTGFHNGVHSLGWPALMLLFVHAYSLGGGTYTGIEAVSNGLPIMREPRIQTAKRTMFYMAVSLAFTASGLLLCYLLWNVHPEAGKTMNAVLFEKLTSGIPGGAIFVIIALIAEGLLLVVAAQAGFIDGPRVLANMATDSWFPRRFAALSDRLTQGNGIILMGIAALGALLYTQGDVGHLVVMYSINVFLTFSLSIFGMLKFYIHHTEKPHRKRNICLFAFGFILCATILVITVLEKFLDGGWVTLAVTTAVVSLCFWVKRHYVQVATDLRHLHVRTDNIPPNAILKGGRTAVILVGGYGNLGLHTMVSILRTFPGVYGQFIFASVAVIDSGSFKGEHGLGELKTETQTALNRYKDYAEKLGATAATRFGVGTEVVQTGFELCQQIEAENPGATFFTGKVIFETETWYQRLLHNETAFSMQKRIQLAGFTMVIMPARLTT